MTLIALIAFATTPVEATEALQPNVLAMLNECRAVAANDQRLACFDRVAASIETMVQTKNVVIIDRKTLENERRRQFGLLQTNDPSYRAADVRQPVELKGRVLSVTPVGQFNRIAIDGLGLWQTTEQDYNAPAVGSEVIIRKGLLGSFMLSFDHSSVRIRRLR